MKFYKILLALVLVVIFISPISASAATSAGVKPRSFWYGFDIAFEKINLFFTFSPEKKAQKALEYADERLAEAEAVANEKNTDAVKTAVAGYESNIASAAEESKQVKDKIKTEELLNSIADNTSKHQEILAEVYNKVPDEAKSAIEKAIEISTKNHENALKEIQGLKKTVEELQKDIESLKQQGQSDQSKEIEVLRKEVETLKSQQSSQSDKPQVVEKVVEKIVEIPPATSQKSTTKLSNSEIIEKVKPAVVYIQTSDGSGSGMIIESNGYILTNAHVVSGFSTAKIKLSDGRLFIGSVVGRDEKIDLALLKIQGNNLPTVVLGDFSTDVLEQGDEVFAFGYPFGLEGDVSFKEGTISRRQIYEGTTYLETSAQIHPGNSGGPLVNRYAQVVGVNTQSVGTGVSGVLVGESIKFALPINLARGLIIDLKSGRNVMLPKITLPSLPTPSPTPTPQPLPTPDPTPAPSCAKDTWSCSDWSECSSSGSQTRTCNITFDCSVANTSSPNTTQSCTPPFPSIPISLQDISSVERIFSITNLTSEKITIEKLRLRLNSLIGSDGTSILPSANAFIYISVNFPKSYDKSSYYPLADRIPISSIESGIFDFIWREQVGKNCYGYVDDPAIPKECLRTGINRLFRNELQPNETMNIRIAFDERVLAGYSTLEVICPKSYQFYLDYINGSIIRKSTGENISFSNLPMKDAHLNDSCQVIQ
ncbi:MAG: trypsin-like peptidase domain-containing protein [Candidatus Azambacteria bacterium]|nr:trypsin-like peptidase domain-containing protein [Candidatus Azambacteria bacterium]